MLSLLCCPKALLSLCSDESASGKGALDLCVNQMKNVLSSQQLPENASMETIGRAYHATETFVQVRFGYPIEVKEECLYVLLNFIFALRFAGSDFC